MDTSLIDTQWGADRAEAYRSEDPIAKRCAVNGQLWETFSHLKKLGKSTETNIRKLIHEDIAMAKFFPDEQDIARYTRGGIDTIESLPDPRTGEILRQHAKHLAKTGAMKEMLTALSCDGKITFPKEFMI